MLSKPSIISALAERTGQNKAACGRVLEAFAKLVGEELVDGREVNLPGVGKLVPVKRPARLGRNPRDGSVIEIAEKTSVRYRTAKPLADRLNAS